MAWRNAPALLAIKADADRVAPGRSHASDGTIGDAAHSASVSDHNPDARGVVHAVDITNDPAHGFDAWHWAQVIAARIAAGVEHRVKYLVSNDGKGADVIFNPSVSMSWRQNGSYKTEHRNHLHVSIKYTDAAENDTSPFFSAGPVSSPSGGAPVPQPAPAPGPSNWMASLVESMHHVVRKGDTGEAVGWVQALLKAKHFALPGAVDANPATASFGPKTEQSVKNFQAQSGLVADGVVGPKTWAALTSAAPVGPPVAAPAAPATPPPTLKEGARSDTVRILQQLLVNNGASIAVDSAFGPKTTAAVKAFQKKKGLAADGIVGPKTWAALGR